MGLFGLIAGLPLMPVRGVLGFAAAVRDEAAREYHDLPAVRRRLEEIAEARDAGLLSDEQAAQMELEAVQRLTWRPWTAPAEIGPEPEQGGIRHGSDESEPNGEA